MPARVSESFVLRTYPLKEADLIVSFLARDQGKLRGVARRARRPKSNFGSGLERLSQVKMYYFQRENQELASLDSCDLIQSQFQLASCYEAAVALDFIADATDRLLPPHETNEKFFRLLVAVLEHLRAGPEAHVWPSVTYFSLWAVRLSGFLPEMRLSAESIEIAEEMLRTPIGQLTPRQWSRATGWDLRRALVAALEEHLERRLGTAAILDAL